LIVDTIIKSKPDKQLEKLEESNAALMRMLVQMAKDEKVVTESLESSLRLTAQNNEFNIRQKEYKQFFSLIFDAISEDTVFLRSEFFRRFGSIPEYQEVNSQIIAFETKLQQLKILLKEQKMIESLWEDDDRE
jgi:hypothetical protein